MLSLLSGLSGTPTFAQEGSPENADQTEVLSEPLPSETPVSTSPDQPAADFEPTFSDFDINPETPTDPLAAPEEPTLSGEIRPSLPQSSQQGSQPRSQPLLEAPKPNPTGSNGPIPLQIQRSFGVFNPPQSSGGLPSNATSPASGSTAESAPLVIFSERSSGCYTALPMGQNVPSSLCTQIGSPSPVYTQTPTGEIIWQPNGNGAINDWQGSGSFAQNLPSMPDSPLAVAVDALGQMFEPSLNVMDYYARTLRPQARSGNQNRHALFPLGFLAPITSAFGWRMHPIFGDWRLHTGLDLGASWGEPVYAALSGRVMVADFLGGYGLTVVLQHDNQDQETLYGHLSEIFVQPGEWINQGEAIGRVGSTGNSTGPHLHFELRQWTEEGWVALDPNNYLDESAETFAAQFARADDSGALVGTQKKTPETSDASIDPRSGLNLNGEPTQLGRAIVWLLTTLQTLESHS